MKPTANKGELFRDGVYICLQDGSPLGEFLFQINVLPSYSEELREERLGIADKLVELWNQSLKPKKKTRGSIPSLSSR